jgi:hypothetical protein
MIYADFLAGAPEDGNAPESSCNKPILERARARLDPKAYRELHRQILEPDSSRVAQDALRQSNPTPYI